MPPHLTSQWYNATDWFASQGGQDVRQGPDVASSVHHDPRQLDSGCPAPDEREQHPHLPVTNAAGELLGLLTRTTLEEVLPSKLTTLSVFELQYQLDKIKVRDAMLRQSSPRPKTCRSSARPASCGRTRSAACPSCAANALVIVTDHDLIDHMLDLLEWREPSIRLTVQSTRRTGEIAKITTAIAQAGATSPRWAPIRRPIRWHGGCS